MPTVYKASAPGSCMLLGEYAVLKNEPAVVVAVDRQIHVTLKPRKDNNAHIYSALGELFAPLEHIPNDKPFQFVAECIQQFAAHPSGFDLYIESNMSEVIGFGTSAAVTVATLACLLRFRDEVFTPQELLLKARDVIQNVQGSGSGADVAASVYGGVIAYERELAQVERFYLEKGDLHLIYCGYKTPTPEVIKIVEKKFSRQEKEFNRLIKAIGGCVNMGKKALKAGLPDKLGLAMRFNHVSMMGLGVSDKTLSMISEAVNKLPNIHGVKISGSGLGDCMIVLGELPKNTFPQNEEQAKLGIFQIDIKPSEHGIEVIEWEE